MLSTLALTWVVFAAQVIQAVHGRLALRVRRSGSNRGGHTSSENHTASQLWPKSADFFEMEGEQVEVEPPNLKKPDVHVCHPKCWWDCGLPAKCETKCKPTCSPPRCVTTCEKQSMIGCSRLCEDPKCAVICPEACATGGCPECTTTCNKPKCSLDCGRKCSSKCDDPVCAWNCTQGDNCQTTTKPTCKMRCEKAKCDLPSVKGKEENNLIDIYRGFGDPTEERAAVYAVNEAVRIDYAKVPTDQITGVEGAPMTGPLAMGSPATMGSPSWMRPPWRRTYYYHNNLPWRVGYGPPPVPCWTCIPNHTSGVAWHKPPDLEREALEAGAQRS